MTALEIINKYIAFFEKREHKKIINLPLVPENDPSTLFTSSGMQPLVPYLLGEPHSMGKRLVNVQNCFRTQDIDEVGDNRHTTFFRMLGNWSLGDYFKKEQLSWIWEFITKELKIPKEKLYITIFKGYKDIPKDTESEKIWTEIFTKEGLKPKERIFFYDTKNWWSRAGEPDKMPADEPGGPDSEIFFEFDVPHNKKFGDECHPNCDCGRFIEISNSVFMEYQKQADGSFKKLPKLNVDHGAGVERLLAAVENKQDIFTTSLFEPIIKSIEKQKGKSYKDNEKEMRIIANHLISAGFIIAAGIYPSNKEQGYILRRLIRRAIDQGDAREILSSIVEQYKITDPLLESSFEKIINVITEETNKYKLAMSNAKKFIEGKYKKIGDELMGTTEISADDAFILYTTHGLSPTQIKSLGYIFDDQGFAEKMKSHQNISRAGATKKFAGGLADNSEQTIRGHTSTHLLHKALRDMFGEKVKQSGSNITSERLRFDFSFDRNLTPEELKKIVEIINKKIKENLPVKFEMLPLEKARTSGAIGLFNEKYSDKVKAYSIGDYSKEICGGPHVAFTSEIKSFKIVKQENIGKGIRRIYAKVG